MIATRRWITNYFPGGIESSEPFLVRRLTCKISRRRCDSRETEKQSPVHGSYRNVAITLDPKHSNYCPSGQSSVIPWQPTRFRQCTLDMNWKRQSKGKLMSRPIVRRRLFVNDMTKMCRILGEKKRGTRNNKITRDNIVRKCFYSPQRHVLLTIYWY